MSTDYNGMDEYVEQAIEYVKTLPERLPKEHLNTALSDATYMLVTEERQIDDTVVAVFPIDFKHPNKEFCIIQTGDAGANIVLDSVKTMEDFATENPSWFIQHLCEKAEAGNSDALLVLADIHEACSYIASEQDKVVNSHPLYIAAASQGSIRAAKLLAATDEENMETWSKLAENQKEVKLQQYESGVTRLPKVKIGIVTSKEDAEYWKRRNPSVYQTVEKMAGRA